jgi:hypothetical protein
MSPPCLAFPPCSAPARRARIAGCGGGSGASRPWVRACDGSTLHRDLLSPPGDEGDHHSRGARRARAGGTTCRGSPRHAPLPRSGRAPARPGGHARRAVSRRAVRDRQVVALRPTGRSAASRIDMPYAPPRRVRPRRRNDAPAIPPRRAVDPPATHPFLEAAELLLGRAVTPGVRCRGAPCGIVRWSRSGRPGGRPLRGLTCRAPRHDGSARVGEMTRRAPRLDVPWMPPPRTPSSKRPSSCSAGRSRPACGVEARRAGS